MLESSGFELDLKVKFCVVLTQTLPLSHRGQAGLEL